MSVTKPYDHQIQVLKYLTKTKQLLVLPSGSGKTHTVAFDVNIKRPKTFLYIVHRNEIVYQSMKIFKQVCGSWLSENDIGILNHQDKNYDKPYLFATVQTLSKLNNLEKLDPNIDYLAVDEFHHVAADTYVRILEYFKPKILVGMTATPYRLDDKDIMAFVDHNVAGDIDLFDGIKQGILVPFKYLGLYDDIDYTKIKWSGYTYNVGDLDRKLIIHKRDKAVLEQYRKFLEPEKRQTIGFCNSINHVNRATDLFLKEGINAIGLTHKDKEEYRREVIADFRTGKYQVLFTRDIFNEGIDFPEVQGIMFLRPTISKTIFFQQLGRGLRKNIGKKNVIVLDFIGNYKKAFEKKSWFLQFAQLVGTGKMIKPEFHYDPEKPEVIFEKRVLEMMEIQTQVVTKEDIVADYLYCCSKSDNQILNSQQYDQSPHKKYSLYHLIQKWGKFSNFITENDLPYTTSFERKFPVNFFSCHDKDLLIKNYHSVREKLIKENWVPKFGYRNKIIPLVKHLNDPKYSKYSQYCYQYNYGRYSNFLKSIGEIADHEYTRNDTIETKQAKIKDAIALLQNKLGTAYISSSDWFNEFGANFGRDLITAAGGFAKFRQQNGVPDFFLKPCGYCGKEMICKTMRTKNCCSQHCTNRFFYEKLVRPRKEKAAAKRKLETIECLQCGKVVLKYNGSNKKQFCTKFCNQRYRIAQGRPILEFINCLGCGKKVNGPFFADSKQLPKYCSENCRSRHYYKTGKYVYYTRKTDRKYERKKD